MQLQISGQITGLEQRNGGWVAVAITEPGNEYPKKLSTKKPDLIQQAQSLMGQMVTAAYNESESNQINPHNGQPYVNRYLEALALGQVQLAAPQQNVVATPVMQQPFVQQPQTFAPQPQQAFTPTPVPTTDAREMKIMRQAAAKVSVALLQHLDEGERNLASLVRISEQLVKYFNQGVPWETAPVAQPVAPAVTQADYQPGAEDDIPF